MTEQQEQQASEQGPDQESEQPELLIRLTTLQEVQWVAAWANNFPAGDEWAKAVAETLAESVAAQVLSTNVCMGLPSSRVRDLATYTEVAGGALVKSDQVAFGVPIYTLALPDTEPPPLVDSPADEHPVGKRIAMPPHEVGWMLCWLRQHEAQDAHVHEEGAVARLLAALPDCDEGMDYLILSHLLDECWDSLTAFMRRHGWREEQLPEDMWDNGHPVWVFNQVEEGE